MKKPFCDVCGESAIEQDLRTSTELEMETIQDKHVFAVAAVVFNIRNHPTGFGGPPDLCKKCRVKMLYNLWKDAEDERLNAR